ncbi:hypothetical protein KSS87_021449 [Heliosperma pusillum]|nr:hypothetical protein KSS87_021449 [Heliosperma pusillum]
MIFFMHTHISKRFCLLVILNHFSTNIVTNVKEIIPTCHINQIIVY